MALCHCVIVSRVVREPCVSLCVHVEGEGGVRCANAYVCVRARPRPRQHTHARYVCGFEWVWK